MKTNLFTLAAVLLGSLSLAGRAQESSTFRVGTAGDIHPQGWLQTMLQRQHDGLTGHPEALSYPYNSCLWAGDGLR